TKILPLTERALVLERGMIAYEGKSRELIADPETMASLLGVTERKPAKH
ncbi:MAG: ABC transporter ATP-binding protein, partial [Bradyrhizobium sp.]|nr:ABC transporter ATP-binding protein [Bradyrhizobium sp.]